MTCFHAENNEIPKENSEVELATWAIGIAMLAFVQVLQGRHLAACVSASKGRIGFKPVCGCELRAQSCWSACGVTILAALAPCHCDYVRRHLTGFLGHVQSTYYKIYKAESLDMNFGEFLSRVAKFTGFAWSVFLQGLA